ncbi:MAG: FAD-dependent oxidoreductase [Actinobacteria bacterium]|nr:FAD-dependent oxidoreductase [Actinomycetota bacterium]
MDGYDLVVLGGGTGGLVSALIAAGVGARVALVERDRTGGDCLWTGCVPSKSLLAAAGLAHRMRHADAVGLAPVEPAIDFSRVMGHVRSAIGAIEQQDSPGRLRAAGVEVIAGEGRFSGPGQLEVGGRLLRFRAAIIATGSEPRLPTLEGLAAAGPLTSDTIWDLDGLPARLVVLGGGPVACELGQAFGRLGSRVTIVEQAARLLTREEPRAGDLVATRLAAEGADVRLGAHAVAVEDGALVLADGHRIPFDRLLVAVGRSPRSVGLGLETVGVALDGEGAVEVDRRLRTSARGIYAVGDVTGLLPFTHVAAHHARVATPNALFHARTRVGEALPWATFTDPEVGRVGLTEEQARHRWGAKAVVVESDHGPDRAITAGEPGGFVKLVGDPRGTLVGATVVGPAAGETVAGLAVLLARRARIEDVSRTVQPYPTFSEAPARAADAHLASRYSRRPIRALSRAALALLRRVDRPRSENPPEGR